MEIRALYHKDTTKSVFVAVSDPINGKVDITEIRIQEIAGIEKFGLAHIKRLPKNAILSTICNVTKSVIFCRDGKILYATDSFQSIAMALVPDMRTKLRQAVKGQVTSIVDLITDEKTQKEAESMQGIWFKIGLEDYLDDFADVDPDLKFIVVSDHVTTKVTDPSDYDTQTSLFAGAEHIPDPSEHSWIPAEDFTAYTAEQYAAFASEMSELDGATEESFKEESLDDEPKASS